ncbi:MAG: MarR family transcriptional regulator [Chloroflexales bacterium]|nr:MarR family transcriptional regulator [Chloroflexales bacterium]
MKNIRGQTSSVDLAATCAALMLELAPLVMREVRKELAVEQQVELSVPQFRALRFVARRPQASLSELALHLGTTRPAASKLADRLVELGLLDRSVALADRRQAALTLTDRGQGALRQAREAVQAQMAERLGSLASWELEHCAQSLTTLRALFVSSQETESNDSPPATPAADGQ